MARELYTVPNPDSWVWFSIGLVYREMSIDDTRKIHWGSAIIGLYAMLKKSDLILRGFNKKTLETKENNCPLFFKTLVHPDWEKTCVILISKPDTFIIELAKTKTMVGKEYGLFSLKRQGQGGSPWSLSFHKQQGEAEHGQNPLLQSEKSLHFEQGWMVQKPLAAWHTHKPLLWKALHCVMRSDHTVRTDRARNLPKTAK